MRRTAVTASSVAGAQEAADMARLIAIAALIVAIVSIGLVVTVRGRGAKGDRTG